MKVSLTGIGIIVFSLTQLFKYLGVEVDENSLTAFVENVISVVSFVMMVWGQWRRNDVKSFVFKHGGQNN